MAFFFFLFLQNSSHHFLNQTQKNVGQLLLPDAGATTASAILY